MTTTRVPVAPESSRLRLVQVAQLIEMKAWPSVSILLDTTPAPLMADADARRLETLIDEAGLRLRTAGVVAPERIVARLEQLAAEASSGATGRGLALFASQAVARRVRLPVSVAPRAVVEHTFATRDLVRALHRTPPYLALVLHDTCAHVYEATADSLAPVHAHGFPFERAITELEAVSASEDAGTRFLAEVDAAFGRLRAERPTPMVLAGAPELTARFIDRAESLYRLAGVLATAATTSPRDLYVETRAAVEAYLLSREAEALWTLEHALITSPDRVATGIDACWAAARTAARAMLVVEEGFTVATDDRHDAVDDLIENVIERGGWVALARDGLLEQHGHVALVRDRRAGDER